MNNTNITQIQPSTEQEYLILANEFKNQLNQKQIQIDRLKTQLEESHMRTFTQRKKIDVLKTLINFI